MDQDLDKLIDFEEAERSYQPTKNLEKARQFSLRRQAKRESAPKGPTEAFAKNIRETVFPKVQESVHSTLDFTPIPGPALDMFNDELEEKLMTWDRKNMSEHERIKILTDLHFKRQRAYAAWKKRDKDPFKLWKESLSFSGNRLWLRSDWFTFSDTTIEKDADLIERTYSLPPVYYGINSKTQYLYEYSNICYWGRSKVSWALSSGLSNANSFTMTSRLTPSPRLWQAVALMAEPAKRFCGAHWFEAIMKALDSWTHYPDGTFVEPIKYPKKPYYGVHSEPGMVFEIFNGFYEIQSRRFSEYFDLWTSTNQLDRLKFLMFCAFTLERPEIPEDQILSAIEDIQATPDVGPGTGIGRSAGEISLAEWYSAYHSCPAKNNSGIECNCPEVRHISNNDIRAAEIAERKGIDFDPFTRRYQVHIEYEFFNDGFLTSSAIDDIINSCKDKKDIDKIASVLPPPDRAALLRRVSSKSVGFDLADLMNKIGSKEHTPNIDSLTPAQREIIARCSRFSRYFAKIAPKIILKENFKVPSPPESIHEWHSIVRSISSLGSDLFFGDNDMLYSGENYERVEDDAEVPDKEGSEDPSPSLFKSKFDEDLVSLGRSSNSFVQTSRGSVEPTGDRSFNLAGVPLSEVNRVPLITLDEYTSDPRFFVRKRVFHRGIT
jgi:hypothetical protein